MSKFTKEKWEYSDDTSVKIPETLYFSPICNWFRVFNRKKKIGIALVPEEANARLIAAAPEMYDLLEDVAWYLEQIADDDDESSKYASSIQELLARIDGEDE